MNGRNAEEIREILQLPDDLTEDEIFAPISETQWVIKGCGFGIDLQAKKLEDLKERERVKNVEVEEHVDDRSVDELLSFINGGDGGMVAAALVEMKRLSIAKSVGPSTQTLPMSVFFLVPQFFLVGSGEAFIYTGQLDFFITQSPKGMKTMSTGLFLTTLSLGIFLSSFLVSVVKKVTSTNDGEGWLADHINYGRLDCFYGLLAVLGFINLVVYLICVVWYIPQQT